MNKGLRGILFYLWKFRMLAVPGLLGLIASDAAQLVVPMVIKSAVDALGTGHATREQLAVYCWQLLGLTAFIVVARFSWRHFLFSAARLSEMDIRERLLRQVLSLPASWHSKSRTGEVMALATNDVEAVRMALDMGMVATFDATIFAGVALVMLAFLDWRLMLWTILPFPLLAVVMAVSLRLIYDRWDEVQSSFERLTEKARESVAGMRVLRAYVQDEGDRRAFERHAADNFKKKMDYVKVDAIFHPVILLLAGMSTAILLGVGGAQVIRGETTLGTFTAFTSYLGMLTWPMIAAGWVLSMMQRGAASMARILDMLEHAPEPESLDGGTPVPLDGAIEARGLTFGYPSTDAPVLQDVTFKVPAGGTLGVVGEVGSGKSTLALLLARIYDPPRGTLFVGGRDVLDVPLAQLRGAIAMVPQEPFLFSVSIEANLRMGAAQASAADLEAATQLAAVHEDVKEFPQGYQTLLGERGVTLSGGQKQRVSLARALLKSHGGAPILVLDDTLSAVDAEAERRIVERMRGAMQGRTAIVISHRISAVRDLDWILVLQKGRVVQQGRHQDLLTQAGYYQDMHELQLLEAQ